MCSNVMSETNTKINDLPTEILIKIFDMAVLKEDAETKNEGKQRKVLRNLAASCKRFREVIDFYYIFEKNCFFEKDRSGDGVTSCYSDRKFRRMLINVQQVKFTTLQWYIVRDMVENSGDILKDIDLNFCISQTLNVPMKQVELSMVIEYLKSLKDMGISLHLEKMLEILPSTYPLLGSPRQDLENRRQNFNLLMTTQIPNLKKFKINYDECLNDEFNTIFWFLEYHIDTLEELILYSFDSYFKYTKESLEIKDCCWIRKYLMVLLQEERMENVKELKLVCNSGTTSFIHFIVNGCKNVEKLTIRHGAILQMPEETIIPSVTELRILGFLSNPRYISKVHQMFPNVKEVHFSNIDKLGTELTDLLSTYFNDFNIETFYNFNHIIDDSGHVIKLLKRNN